MKILVTGAAGFIGYHLCNALLEKGNEVVGLDNVNDYYDTKIKFDRLNLLGISRNKAEKFNEQVFSKKYNKFSFIRLNIEDRKSLPLIFEKNQFDSVCNLAAQAGVRYSFENPETYIDSNVVGFLNVLECCRNYNIKRLVYASSSSVYGNNKKIPFEEIDNVDFPVSLYAASKKSNELMAHTYSHLFNFETIGLRFFTVYGPWGRPDMALFLFTKAMLCNETIDVFNKGNLSRDFTYIDDIIEGVCNTILKDSRDKKNSKIYNIGNNSPVNLLDFISHIEKELGFKSKRKLMPMQPGDVNMTWANVEKLKNDYDFSPKITIQEGVKEFISWYLKYYDKKK